jgi:tRNA(Ile)-lysidine synthase
MMAKQKKIEKRDNREQQDFVQSLGVVLRRKFGVTAGERIGLGVSGGADSVALLRLMAELREKLGIVPCVAHFNHQLRGKAADADEKFVAKLAAQHGLEFFVERENVAALAKREKCNVEDAARRARYAYFERLVKEGHLKRVAVAHTADDQAETVLAHILRGTGIAGLGGIHPEAGCVFRPLLTMRRAGLRAYLRSLRQAWREDRTNKDVTRTRARIRMQLLPMLEKRFNPAVVEHLCQLAELAREDNAQLDGHAELRLRALSQERDGGVAIAIRDIALGMGTSGTESPKDELLPDWRGSARAIAKRMVRQLVRRVKPQAGELGAKHVEAALHLAAFGHSGKVLQLPGGVEVRREREALLFRAAEGAGNAGRKGKETRGWEQRPGARAYAREVRLPPLGQTLRLDAPSRILQVRVIDWPSEGRETTEWRAVLDRERLGVPLVLRNWKPGDVMRPAGHRKRHTVARLLNELGRTRWEKETWPVLESAGQVAWALGLPVAEEFAVAPGSRAGVVITEESAK